MSNQETIVVKKDLTNGNIHESTRWHLDVASAIVGTTNEDRTTTRKWAIDFISYLVIYCWLIPHSETSTASYGARRINDITEEGLMMDVTYLSTFHQYHKLSNPDLEGFENIFGLPVIPGSPEFQLNFESMGELPTKLIKEEMKELADIMDNQGCNTRQRYKTVGDLLGPVRYFQWQIMRIVRLTFIWTTIHQQIEPLDADIMIESFPMQQLEAYIRLFQDPATLELPELCLAGPNAVRDIMSPPVMEPADDAFDPTTSEPPVLSLAGPDAVRDAMSPSVMAPAEDALDRQQPSATSFSGESNDLPYPV